MDIDYYILTGNPVTYHGESCIAVASYDDGTATIVTDTESKDVLVSELGIEHE